MMDESAGLVKSVCMIKPYQVVSMAWSFGWYAKDQLDRWWRRYHCGCAGGSDMSHIMDAAMGVFLCVFIAGILAGILVIAGIAFHRDPLKGAAPDDASAGVRWLVQASRRDGQRGSAEAPYGQPPQDRELRR